MHQTRARLRPRRGRRGCGLGYICRRFCGVGHGLLPYIVLLWVKGELRLRCRFFLRGRQVVVALFQFIPHGAHCPHARRCGCDETGQQCQCKAPAAQKLFDLLHCRYSHLLHCVRIASGLSVGQQGRFYARNDLKWPPFHSGHNSGIAFIVMQNRSDRGLTGSAFSREGPQPENASSLCGLLC